MGKFIWSKEIGEIIFTRSEATSGKDHRKFRALFSLVKQKERVPEKMFDWIGIRPLAGINAWWDPNSRVGGIVIPNGIYKNGGKDWLGGLLAEAKTAKHFVAVAGNLYDGGDYFTVLAFPIGRNPDWKEKAQVDPFAGIPDVGESAHVLAADERFAPVQEQVGLEVETQVETPVEEPKPAFVPRVRNRRREAK